MKTSWGISIIWCSLASLTATSSKRESVKHPDFGQNISCISGREDCLKERIKGENCFAIAFPPSSTKSLRVLKKASVTVAFEKFSFCQRHPYFLLLFVRFIRFVLHNYSGSQYWLDRRRRADFCNQLFNATAVLNLIVCLADFSLLVAIIYLSGVIRLDFVEWFVFFFSLLCQLSGTRKDAE